MSSHSLQLTKPWLVTNYWHSCWDSSLWEIKFCTLIHELKMYCTVKVNSENRKIVYWCSQTPLVHAVLLFGLVLLDQKSFLCLWFIFAYFPRTLKRLCSAVASQLTVWVTAATSWKLVLCPLGHKCVDLCGVQIETRRNKAVMLAHRWLSILTLLDFLLLRFLSSWSLGVIQVLLPFYRKELCE